jgi:hypothetical protein
MHVASLDELIDCLGVTKQALTGLRQRGIIIRLRHNEYDLGLSCKNYVDMLRKRAEPGLLDARASYAKEKAALVRMQRQEREGVLVHVDQVRDVWMRVVMMVRQRALALPSRCAVLVAHHNVPECFEILTREIRSMLTDLSEAEIVVEGEGEEAAE